MQNSTITSHFIALPIYGLDSLFMQLHEYIQQHNLSENIIVQNNETTHVTLDCLDKEIDLQQTYQAIDTCAQIFKNTKVETKHINYFNESILYIEAEHENLLQINEYLVQHLPSNASERALPFKGHITLLRIKNGETYQSHKENIEAIINNASKKITTGKLSLYSADSTQEPEFQKIIYQAQA